MLERRAGIVLQALEREIRPGRIEERERFLAVLGDEFTVGDLVTNHGKFGRGEMARNLGALFDIHFRALGLIPDIRVGDLHL